jgi:hypothetical protein
MSPINIFHYFDKQQKLSTLAYSPFITSIEENLNLLFLSSILLYPLLMFPLQGTVRISGLLLQSSRIQWLHILSEAQVVLENKYLVAHLTFVKVA